MRAVVRNILAVLCLGLRTKREKATDDATVSSTSIIAQSILNDNENENMSESVSVRPTDTDGTEGTKGTSDASKPQDSVVMAESPVEPEVQDPGIVEVEDPVEPDLGDVWEEEEEEGPIDPFFLSSLMGNLKVREVSLPSI